MINFTKNVGCVIRTIMCSVHPTKTGAYDAPYLKVIRV